MYRTFHLKATEYTFFSSWHGTLSWIQHMLLFSCLIMSDSLWPHRLQHSSLSCSSLTPRVSSSSHPLIRWCHPTISSSVTPFSSCPQSFPLSVFSNKLTLHIRWPKYWSFIFSISPSKEYSGLISFSIDWLDLSNGVSGVFSSTTVQKHQFFSAQPSLWSSAHSHTWVLKKTYNTRYSTKQVWGWWPKQVSVYIKIFE